MQSSCAALKRIISEARSVLRLICTTSQAERGVAMPILTSGEFCNLNLTEGPPLPECRYFKHHFELCIQNSICSDTHGSKNETPNSCQEHGKE